MTEVDCGEPPQPTNGELVLSETTYGSMATFSCNQGYDLIGSEVRVCQADGSWDGEITVCERKTDIDIFRNHVCSYIQTDRQTDRYLYLT